MSGEVANQFKTILKKLEKLDSIEESLRSTQASPKSLEQRTERLEAFHASAKEDIREMKESLNSHDQAIEELKTQQSAYETEMAEIRQKIKSQEDKSEELHMKDIYKEAYSRRENIKFNNVQEFPTADNKEDTKELLRRFLERDLGYVDARSVEIQRVHRIGKHKNGAPRPILARFLRCKACEGILSLGHRLKGTNFQMFKGLDCRIPRNSSCSAQPPKIATRSEQALGMKGSATSGNE